MGERLDGNDAYVVACKALEEVAWLPSCDFIGVASLVMPEPMLLRIGLFLPHSFLQSIMVSICQKELIVVPFCGYSE